MWRKTGLMGCILGLALVAGTARGGLISTQWNAIDNTGDFNDGISDTFGQTFTVVGGDTLLEDFSFWFADTASIQFKAYVAEWTGTHAGNVQWTSSVIITSGGGGFTEYTFQPNLELQNQVYVAFVSSLDAPSTTGVGYFGANKEVDNYLGGDFFLSLATDLSSLFSMDWENGYVYTSNDGEFDGYNDLAFEANLKSPDPPAIPEPSSLAVLSVVFACVTLRRARRHYQVLKARD